jgi:hypothetical protein
MQAAAGVKAAAADAKAAARMEAASTDVKAATATGMEATTARMKAATAPATVEASTPAVESATTTAMKAATAAATTRARLRWTRERKARNGTRKNCGKREQNLSAGNAHVFLPCRNGGREKPATPRITVGTLCGVNKFRASARP